MNKKLIYVILALAVIFVTGIILHDKKVPVDTIPEENETVVVQEETDGDIIPIPVEELEGISSQEAVELCYAVMGEKDSETGFIFSFGVSGAVQRDNKKYYVIRGSWLVDNSHMSYIGDFFVTSDGKEVYTGTALDGEYSIGERIWSKK